MRFLSGCLLLGLSATLAAQPSGGPYGPIRQKYKLPTGAGKIHYVAPDGQAEQTGESLSQPTTIEAAIARVRTGDAIIMRGGTYRTGNLILNQGITIQPYAEEQPVLKGTLVASEWKKQDNGVWVTTWPRLFPARPAEWWRRPREGTKTPLHRFNNDMVFIDGRMLQSAGWEGEVDENTFFIDYETGLVYLAVDPTDKVVEITAFDVALLRTTRAVHGKSSDRQGYTIRGITFTQYAYRALEIEGTEPEGLSHESQHGKEVVGTTLEHCTISFCSRVAGYLRGDRMTIRHCRVSDTSTEGLYIIASNDVLLEKNIFTRNNIENITGYPAAVKIFNQSHRVRCNDNLVIDHPNSNGIWYDVGNVDGVFTNNWIEGVGRVTGPLTTENLWPSDNGFFFEISRGAICAGNVFVNCDHGLMVLNASNVQIYQNTFVNSMVCLGRNARSAQGDHFGWHPSTGPEVDERDGHVFVNNLLVGDERFNRPLLFVWQPASLCGKLNQPQLAQLDHNVYVRGAGRTSHPLMLWSPAANEKCQTGFDSPQELCKAYPAFAANSLLYDNYTGPLFKGMELGNFQLSPAFPGAQAATSLPAMIKELLAASKPGGRYVGAYASVP